MDAGGIVHFAPFDAGAGLFGHVGFEITQCLLYQFAAVGQKEHAPNPFGPHQQVDQGDDGAGFARAGSHHQ